MDRSRIIAVLSEHADEIRAHGVTRLALFGSAVRGEARPGSDIDLLIEVDRERRFSLVDFVDLQDYLSHLLGRHADLAEAGALAGSRARESVLRDAIEIFR